MLRALLAVLVVANVLFFAFSRGTLDGLFGWFGLSSLNSRGDREPERLTHQVRPQTIQVLPISAAASAPVDPGVACYETPTFTGVDAVAVETALAGNLPAGSWSDSRGERTVGTRTEVTHTYRVAAADAALAARLATLKLDAAGRGFSFSACARPERPR